MAQSFNIIEFESEPVLGIVRGVSKESLNGVLNAAIAAGLHFLEITLNTENAPNLIEIASKNFDLCIGAGTVLNLQEAKTAYNSGASFIVSPTLNQDVADFCGKRKVPYFPGAFTPTEVEKAWHMASATMVKIFPASRLGPNYIKELLGPFPKMKLMAVGGVELSNIRKYLQAGASGLAVGSSVFTENRMRNRDYKSIEKDLKDFLLEVRDF